MTTKDPLNTPADAKGRKIRTAPTEMQRWTLEAMGFGVQIMPLPEVYISPSSRAWWRGRRIRWTRFTRTGSTRWRRT